MSIGGHGRDARQARTRRGLLSVAAAAVCSASVATAVVLAANPAPGAVTPQAGPASASVTVVVDTSSSAPAVARPDGARAAVAVTSAGCGERALAAGAFDPSCPEYQGYLDPGTRAGRAPSSGDEQHRAGCEQGWIPRSECD